MTTFRLAVAPTFSLSAKLTIPTGGEAVLPLTVVPLTRTEYQAWQQDATDNDPAPAVWLGRVVVGWGKDAQVLDEHDQPVPFSLDALAKVLDRHPAATSEINIAYSRALHESRAGN